VRRLPTDALTPAHERLGYNGTPVEARPEQIDLIDTDVAIETPEHIVFRHRVAGPGRRALAHIVDQTVCFFLVLAGLLVVMLVAAAIGGSFGFMDGIGAAQGLVLVILFTVEWVYFVAMEAIKGAIDPRGIMNPGKVGFGTTPREGQ